MFWNTRGVLHRTRVLFYSELPQLDTSRPYGKLGDGGYGMWGCWVTVNTHQILSSLSNYFTVGVTKSKLESKMQNYKYHLSYFSCFQVAQPRFKTHLIRVPSKTIDVRNIQTICEVHSVSRSVAIWCFFPRVERPRREDGNCPSST